MCERRMLIRKTRCGELAPTSGLWFHDPLSAAVKYHRTDAMPAAKSAKRGGLAK